MRQATRDRLRELDRLFYERSAEAFDRTRARPWPGMHALAQKLGARRRGATAPARVLDLGCGNGRFLLSLREHLGEPFTYLGIDASEPLLALARSRYASPQVRFEHGDFMDAQALRALGRAPFDLVALLGVLHHVAGEEARRALLAGAAQCVAAGGVLACTLWRFDGSERFARRKLPESRCAALGIDAADLEPGDALLRFGDGDAGIRYAHFVDERELTRLTFDLPLAPLWRFRSDGADGAQNDYVVLARPLESGGDE